MTSSLKDLKTPLNDNESNKRGFNEPRPQVGYEFVPPAGTQPQGVLLGKLA